jgi:serine/threonine-protein kinase
MATVYLADDLKHERKVALKVLKPELAAVVGAERFLAEIKTTANLTHPHILPLHDSGEADSFLFYVMPHIEGESLRERIDREKQLSVDDALAITQKVAGALDYAHQNGVVHRDIKPGNILLSKQGEPLVADFGIALAVAQAGAGRITETGLSLGTPHYMSPEQATGDRDVDPRSDVYALGCVLYEMLAGQPPFSATSAQAVLVKILTADAPSITSERRTVPPHVGHALAQALEKLPADRFTSAAEFATALIDTSFTYEARARTSVVASTPEPVGMPATVPGPWKRLTVAMTTVAVVLAALVAWDWLGPQPLLQPMRAVVDFGDFPLPAPSEIVVSPDGSRFAVAGVLDGQRAIYWREGAQEDFRLIPGTEGNVRFVSFSPDSESLVYADGVALLRVAISGGAPRPVVQAGALAPRDNHWGDDGTIVFTSNADGLYRVPDTGGEPEVLLESTPARNPRLLPGGQAVIFTNPDASSTYLLDLRTDSLIDLIPGGIDAMYVETGHLLYADQAGGLWAVEFNVGWAEVVGEAVPVLDGLSIPRPYWARYSVSQNGTLVYEAGPVGGTVLGAGFNLLVVDLEGGEELLPLPPRDIQRVEVSPDGGSVVYESTAAGDQSPDIYTYNVELRTEPRPLTFEGQNHSPVYSPDGERVVFSSAREGTDSEDLFVKRLDDDTPAELLITLPGAQRPTQWPSDTLIVFEVGPPPVDLWMLDLSDPDSPRAEAYLEQQADLRDIKISPDGTLAAYSSNETGTSQVYIRSFPDPGLQTPVSQGGGQFPFWSPSGDIVHHWTLATVGSGDGDFFMAVHIQRNPTPAVLSRDSLFSGNYYRGASDLHPDGDRLLVAQAVSVRPAPVGEDVEPERTLVVINWFEELRERVGN